MEMGMGMGMVKIRDLLKTWGSDDVFIIRAPEVMVRARRSVLLSERLCSEVLNMYAFNLILRQNEDGEDYIYIHAQKEAAA